MHKLLNINPIKSVGTVKIITTDDVIQYIEFYTKAELNIKSRNELFRHLKIKPSSCSLIFEYSGLVLKFEIIQDTMTLSAQLICGLN